VLIGTAVAVIVEAIAVVIGALGLDGRTGIFWSTVITFDGPAAGTHADPTLGVRFHMIFVDFTVTVGVAPVAAIRVQNGGNVTCVRAGPILSPLQILGTNPRATVLYTPIDAEGPPVPCTNALPAGGRFRWVRLVDSAITIVVDAVTIRIRLGVEGDAGIQNCRIALVVDPTLCLPVGQTGADTAGCADGHQLIGGTVTVIVTTITVVVISRVPGHDTTFDIESIARTDDATHAKTLPHPGTTLVPKGVTGDLVHFAVTVIVQFVLAKLRPWVPGECIAPQAIAVGGTDLDAGPKTCTQAHRAGRARPGKILVGEAIAVIIVAVACLVSRGSGLDAADHEARIIIGAHIDALSHAHPDAHSAGLHQRKGLVDVTITVIIGPVTPLSICR